MSYKMTKPLLLDVFPEARMAPYHKSGESFEQAFTRYQWNIRLAEAMVPALHYLEVSLRNRLNTLIGLHYGHDWLIKRPAILLSEEQKRILDDMRDRHLREKRKEPNHDDLVARMSFGFWYAYFHKRFDPIIWHRKKAMETVFPCLPPERRLRGYVQPRLGAIKDMRNRIAHHEPVWNTKPSLIEIHQTCLDLIAAMSPEALERLKQIDRFLQVWNDN
jgi:hypothetical protein